MPQKACGFIFSTKADNALLNKKNSMAYMIYLIIRIRCKSKWLAFEPQAEF